MRQSLPEDENISYRVNRTNQMSGKVHLENITCTEYQTQPNSGQPLPSAEVLFSSTVQATTAAKGQLTLLSRKGSFPCQTTY